MLKQIWQRWMRLWNDLPRPARIGLLAVMDIALIGLGLCIFALFHHVVPRENESLGAVSARPGAAVQPTAAAVVAAPVTDTAIAAEPVATAEPAPADPVGYFGTKFADKFTNGEVINKVLEDGTGIYQSANLNLTGKSYDTGSVTYHVIDIYIKDIACLKSAFANNKYGTGQRGWPADIAKANNAIAAINGDYYSARDEGTVLRNGELYRDYIFGDACVIYWDGTMQTLNEMEYNIDSIMAKGAYQIWNFGPILLEDGQPMTEFNSAVTARNPRTAIGYYEPGHYCFVCVDGRSENSNGLSMEDLSKLMYDLGCTEAYNLDGGQTSTMVWNGNVINNPYDGGRTSSDIIMVGEP